MSPVTPVRRLYALLCAESSAEDLHTDLVAEHEDYRAMVGDPAPRFCEWSYQRIHERALVSGLAPLHKTTTARKLATLAGAGAADLDGLDREGALRLALARLGIHEPRAPDRLETGVRELERFSAGDGTVADCRRGLERMLKVMTVFLWDAGHDGLIRDVATHGLHRFNALAQPPQDWPEWLFGQEAGTLNHLLVSVDLELRERRVDVPFLGGAERVWSEACFLAVRSLCGALNAELHDRVGREPNPAHVHKATQGLLQKIHGRPRALCLPKAVRFFRQTFDGNTWHHEGLTEEGTPIWCYESGTNWQLHQPYLFVAATNPSAVDMVCTPLRAELQSPVRGGRG